MMVRGDKRVLAQHAPAEAQILKEHARVFLRRLDEHARQRLEPESPAAPRACRAAIAVGERHGQLAAVFVAERGRVEGE